MGRLALVLCMTLVGCTRIVDPPQALPGIPVAPIAAGQVADLMSKHVEQQDGNLFVTVEPEHCSGLAQEVDAPFVFDHNPAAHAGGHWVAPGSPEVYIEEIVGVYRANFDPTAALNQVRDTIINCSGVPFAVTSMVQRSYDFELSSAPDSGAPEIVLWSFSSPDWACDNAFVAAHNAAVELTTCAVTGGFDVLTLAEEALQRIEALADNTL
nr:sensor domain-containing protein [Mycobacterium sp. MS1601]